MVCCRRAFTSTLSYGKNADVSQREKGSCKLKLDVHAARRYMQKG